MSNIKFGLDYFSFDVDFFNDPKIEFISAKYDILGENVCIKLLCRIYRNGYYLPWQEDDSLLFAKKLGGSVNFKIIEEIIIEACKRGFFNENLYKKYNILTSHGIQKRFFEAIRRRKTVPVYKEYLLINTLGQNVNIIPLNDDILKQRKGKERKGKKNNAPAREYFSKFWNAYPKKKSKGSAEKAWQAINPDEQLLATMVATIGRAKKSKEWQKENGKYIPYPATWLRAKGWEDEIEIETEKKLCDYCHDKLSTKNGLCKECHMKLHGF